jgi:hypothetical protein
VIGVFFLGAWSLLLLHARFFWGFSSRGAMAM